MKLLGVIDRRLDQLAALTIAAYIVLFTWPALLAEYLQRRGDDR